MVKKKQVLRPFSLKHEIDTGDIIFRESLEIGDDETVGEVHDRMMILGANNVLKTVQAIENKTVTPLPQLDTVATHAPKIFQETCEIDFSKTTTEVHNFIRGLSPFPTAWTTLDGLKLKIFKAQKEVHEEKGTPQYKSDFDAIQTGKFVSDGKIS